MFVCLHNSKGEPNKWLFGIVIFERIKKRICILSQLIVLEQYHQSLKHSIIFSGYGLHHIKRNTYNSYHGDMLLVLYANINFHFVQLDA